MKHIEGDNDIDMLRYADSVLVAFMGPDSAFKFRPRDFFLQLPKHAVLHIDGNHPAGWTNHLRQFHREKPGATPEIENGHSASDIRPENLPGVLQPSPDPIIETARQPNRTDAFFSGDHSDSAFVCLAKMRKGLVSPLAMQALLQ